METANNKKGQAYEDTHVQQVYEAIAPHFSATVIITDITRL